MNRILISFLFFFNIIFVPVVEAQGLYEPIFRHLTTREGFADNGVVSVLQDQKGFMWFGTLNGLYKYDGNSLQLLRKNFFHNQGWGNVVNNIVEDSVQHKLWMLVENRLFSMDLHTEKVEEEPVPADGDLLTLFAGKSGKLYLSIKGKGVYTRDNMLATKWEFLPNISCQSVMGIQEMPEGNMIVLDAKKGIVVCDSTYAKQKVIPLSVPGVISFYLDSSERLWLGTWSGLFLWNTSRSSFEKIELLEKLFVLDRKPTYFAINCIREDKIGNVFFGTDTGVFVLDKEGKVSNYRSDYNEKSSLSCNFICDLYFDREGTLWVGTYSGGVDYLSPHNKNFTCFEFINKAMEGHSVSAFTEDEQGNIWIATEDAGLTCYQPSTQKFTNYNPLKRKVCFFDVVGIHCLATYGKWLYVGMVNSGVFAYHQESHQVIHLSNRSDVRKRLSSNTIFALCPLPDEKLAIGTMGGLDIYDSRSDSVWHVDAIPRNRVIALQLDEKGNLWICGQNIGVYSSDGKGNWSHFETPQLLTCEWTTMEKTGDMLYLGTLNHGVLAFDLKKGTSKAILDEPLRDGMVYKIIPYKNQLWVSTSYGLFAYDIQKNTYRHYTEGDGLKSRQFNLNSGILTSQNVILLGTIYGLNGFIPEQVSYNKMAPAVVFTDLKVNNESLSAGDKSGVLEKSLPYSQSVELAYNQNNLSLSFASLSYTGEKVRQYRYKLMPFNTDWIYTTSNQLVFNQLQPGCYELLVMGCNSDGIWSKQSAVLDIIVHCPWWFSFPMLMVYVLFMLIGLYLLYYRFKKHQQSKIKRLKIKKQEEIYQLKMDFFTNIIHDIRTPLTLIVAPLQMLRKRKDIYPYHSELDMIYRNSQRLLNNVNQLMDFRKLESNFGMAPQNSWFDPFDKVKNIVDDFRSYAESKGIELHLHLVGISLQIYTDPTMFEKILTNLLSNALKYATAHVNVVLSTESDACELSIEDDGNGIALSEQEHLFEPFYQVSDHLPKDNIGSGVGLYIVKQLLSKMDGTVNLTSDVGKGCKIKITLNCKMSDSLDVSDRIPVKDDNDMDMSLVDSQNTDGKWGIAVVDDNEDMRYLLSSLLKPFYEVYSYSHAEALLNDIDNVSFDLIVSDIMMPGMDGFDLCRKIKSDMHTCHIPLVLLTAKIMEQDEIKGIEYGADAYIRKPFSADLFLARIKSLIRNKERIAEKYINDPDLKMKDTVAANADREFVTQLDEIIQSNLTNTQLTPLFVAQEFSMCRTLFFSKIKAVTGMTFSDYVRIYRLKYAIVLLKERKYTMVEISDMVGFSSQSYFAQCFKKQFNVTPTEFMRHFDES